MKSPINFRNAIPLFNSKTETQFQQDRYERYDPIVLRQTALHLSDEIWDYYPMQSIFDFAHPYLPKIGSPNIVEIGCGTGRWIATLAKTYPKGICWGLDYSYQMLKRAQEYWVAGQTIEIDYRKYGYDALLELTGQQLDNLYFGLAKASTLPFAINSQDLLLHSFLLDRLEDPKKALLEMHRVLKTNGQMIFVSPLNFQQKTHWEVFHPPIKIQNLLLELGFEVLKWQEELVIKEPIDLHGNAIHWKCIAGVLQKK